MSQIWNRGACDTIDGGAIFSDENPGARYNFLGGLSYSWDSSNSPFCAGTLVSSRSFWLAKSHMQLYPQRSLSSQNYFSQVLTLWHLNIMLAVFPHLSICSPLCCRWVITSASCSYADSSVVRRMEVIMRVSHLKRWWGEILRLKRSKYSTQVSPDTVNVLMGLTPVSVDKVIVHSGYSQSGVLLFDFMSVTR